MTKTNTFREHLQWAILETCDLLDICSEWWEDMTWPKKIDKYKDKDNDKDKYKDKDNDKCLHLAKPRSSHADCQHKLSLNIRVSLKKTQ